MRRVNWRLGELSEPPHHLPTCLSAHAWEGRKRTETGKEKGRTEDKKNRLGGTWMAAVASWNPDTHFLDRHSLRLTPLASPASCESCAWHSSDSFRQFSMHHAILHPTESLPTYHSLFHSSFYTCLTCLMPCLAFPCLLVRRLKALPTHACAIAA